MTTQYSSSVHWVGEVLYPGDDGYDDLASTAYASGRPDLIVRPRAAAQVAAAVRYARDAELAVTVRSGGHSAAGLSTDTEGIVVDISPLDGVEMIDSIADVVRIGAGARWGDVADCLQEHGLGITAGDTREVGVGGLTLGGGIGWMVRKYGLALDAVVGAEVVTADGTVLRTDATSHPELFWALRGGGGNTGIVVSLDFAAQRVGTVHFGSIVYGLDDAPGPVSGIVRGWRDAMRAADEDLSASLVLVPAMMGKPVTAMTMVCLADPDPAAAERALRPLRDLAPVVADTVTAMPYASVLAGSDHPPQMRIVVRNVLTPELTDAAVDDAAALFADGQAMVSMRSLGGAVSRVPASATAYQHRDAEAMVLAGFVLPGTPTDHDVQQRLDRWAPMAAHGPGAYANFLGSATPDDVARVYPPSTYRRLAAVKKRYDPGNVFRRNFNVPPAG